MLMMVIVMITVRLIVAMVVVVVMVVGMKMALVIIYNGSCNSDGNDSDTFQDTPPQNVIYVGM